MPLLIFCIKVFSLCVWGRYFSGLERPKLRTRGVTPYDALYYDILYYRWYEYLCIPLFSGFAAKSLIASAAGYEQMAAVTFVLLFASAGVMEHSGIKIPFFAFFAHDSGKRPEEAPWNMLLVP